MHYTNPLAKIKILLVEDDRIMRSLVKDMLDILGFSDVVVAKDGLDAVNHIQNSIIDMVICDWKMPGMDGVSFTKFVRDNLAGSRRSVPIIMLTGRNEENDIKTARDAGTTEYLVKPFTAQTLFERIKAVIEMPRSFVISDDYSGPDRRRKKSSPPDGIGKRDSDQ